MSRRFFGLLREPVVVHLPIEVLVNDIMSADAVSRANGKAPVMENDPSLPLNQQPAMVVHLGYWFGRKPVEVSS